MEIPVYVITGFLESGKTTFLEEILYDKQFIAGERVLVIACEDGEEEYDKEDLKKNNIFVEYVEDFSELTDSYFRQYQIKYSPQKVMIEYNGMWQVDKLFSLVVPKSWVVVQIITTIDASTFDMYLNNMRSLVIGQVSGSDMIIFNRCNADTKKASYRRSIKAVNRKAQIIYESEDGSADTSKDEELPFDINAPVIEIEDDDYGLWYIDALDNPAKYDGKIIKFKGIVARPRGVGKGRFVPGRFAMTCCADDVAFIGFVCKFDGVSSLNEKDWVTVTALVKTEYYKEYKSDGPVLYAQNIEPAKPAEENLVYFN